MTKILYLTFLFVNFLVHPANAAQKCSDFVFHESPRKPSIKQNNFKIVNSTVEFSELQKNTSDHILLLFNHINSLHKGESLSIEGLTEDRLQELSLELKELFTIENEALDIQYSLIHMTYFQAKEQLHYVFQNTEFGPIVNTQALMFSPVYTLNITKVIN